MLPASLAVDLAGASFFKNAVEWAGHRIGIGEGAVGSLLAAVGTALPEGILVWAGLCAAFVVYVVVAG